MRTLSGSLPAIAPQGAQGGSGVTVQTSLEDEESPAAAAVERSVRGEYDRAMADNY